MLQNKKISQSEYDAAVNTPIDDGLQEMKKKMIIQKSLIIMSKKSSMKFKKKRIKMYLLMDWISILT